MIKILNKDFITTKEASKRYGFSAHWFEDRRRMSLEPDYIQGVEKGRVLYDVEKTDEWFRRFMKMEKDA
jgi:hypothetical protein